MSKMKLLSDWASGVAVMTHSRFSETEQAAICPICGERFGNTMSVEQRFPHMLPSTPLNQGGVGTAAQRDKITAARRQLAPNGRMRVAVLRCGDTVGKQYLLQHCMRVMEKAGWSQTEIDAFFIAAAVADYQRQIDRYCFFLNDDGTLYEKSMECNMSEMKQLDEVIYTSEEGEWVTQEDAAGRPMGVKSKPRRKKTFTYTVELKTEWWPRDLADKMLMLNVFVGELLSVKDCQRADHLYAAHNTQPSDTYSVSPPDGERNALDVIMAHLDTLLSPSELEAVREFIRLKILEKR